MRISICDCRKFALIMLDAYSANGGGGGGIWLTCSHTLLLASRNSSYHIIANQSIWADLQELDVYRCQYRYQRQGVEEFWLTLLLPNNSVCTLDRTRWSCMLTWCRLWKDGYGQVTLKTRMKGWPWSCGQLRNIASMSNVAVANVLKKPAFTSSPRTRIMNSVTAFWRLPCTEVALRYDSTA